MTTKLHQSEIEELVTLQKLGRLHAVLDDPKIRPLILEAAEWAIESRFSHDDGSPVCEACRMKKHCGECGQCYDHCECEDDDWDDDL